jgi:hypothetical protein
VCGKEQGGKERDGKSGNCPGKLNCIEKLLCKKENQNRNPCVKKNVYQMKTPRGKTKDLIIQGINNMHHRSVIT